MSIALGINLGKYVFLASDTRTTHFPAPDSPEYEDGYEKIVRTTIGLITGTGSKSLLDAFKQRLVDEKPTLDLDVVRMADEERLSIELEVVQEEPWVRSIFESTAWLLSYIGSRDDVYAMRLGLIHHKWYGRDMGLIEKGQGIVLMPNESNQWEYKEVTNWLNRQLMVPGTKDELAKNIEFHFSLAATIIKKVSAEYESVSPDFHVGVHTIDGLIGIGYTSETGNFHLELKPATD